MIIFKNNIPYFHRATHKGYLRHLLVRKATKTGEIIVDLVTSTQTEGFNEEELLAGFRYELLTRHYDGSFKGVLHTKNDSVADVVKNEGTEVLYGDSYFYEELLGLKFKITPFSFSRPTHSERRCSMRQRESLSWEMTRIR